MRLANRVIELYKQGKGIDEISKECLVSKDIIEIWVKDYEQTAKIDEKIAKTNFPYKNRRKRLNPTYKQPNREKNEYEKIQEEQKQYAQEEVRLYTIENQQKYMEKLQAMFYNGKIHKRNIGKISEELYKYPDKMQSALLLSEFYYMITEKEERAIEELDKYLDTSTSLSREEYKIVQNRISEFRKRIDVREYMQKQEEEKENAERKIRKEQRQYSMEVIKQLKAGEITTKEDAEQIIKKLYQFHDRERAIFLIVKLYELFYDRKELLDLIALYSTFSNLTEQERKFLEETKRSVHRGEVDKKKLDFQKRKVKRRKKKQEKDNRSDNER